MCEYKDKHHGQGCGCGCDHEHREVQTEKKELTEIGTAVIIFFGGILLNERLQPAAAVFFVIAYMLLGRDILKLAMKNTGFR